MIGRENKAAAGVQSAADDRSAVRSPSSVERGILHIGVDLGTSRSAIATSHGVRESVASVVGWPRDTVSSKVIGRDVVVGEEALERRLSLDMVLPLARGSLVYPDLKGAEQMKSRSAAEELMGHLIRLGAPRKGELLYAVIGAPAEATRVNKKAILEMARAAGIDAAMVVSEPFSVAYGIDSLDEAIVIDIGAGTIDLCRLHGTLPEVDDQVTIFKAGNYVVAKPMTFDSTDSSTWSPARSTPSITWLISAKSKDALTRYQEPSRPEEVFCVTSTLGSGSRTLWLRTRLMTVITRSSSGREFA